MTPEERLLQLAEYLEKKAHAWAIEKDMIEGWVRIGEPEDIMTRPFDRGYSPEYGGNDFGFPSPVIDVRKVVAQVFGDPNTPDDYVVADAVLSAIDKAGFMIVAKP